MAEYVDGYVLMIRKSKIAAYKAIAKKASKIWMEHGALDYRECVLDEKKVKMGVPFPKLVGAKASEVVVFSWITYKSRKHRDAVNAKVMNDPRTKALCPDPANMPFSMDRMTYGGFKTLVSVT